MTKVTRKRRWHRFAIPLGLAFATIIGTVTVHGILEPDTSEQHYLSPEKKADSSAVQLADLLRAKGITIQRTTRSSDALTATWAKKGDVTLFIPAPDFVHGDYLWMLRHSPAGTRVVLVEPDIQKLDDAVPRLGIVGKRWATAVTSRGIRVATGEVAANRVIFKQLLQAEAIGVCQVDACRIGGVNEVLSVLLLAAKFNVPVCPHAGGVGLCEYVQHLSMFDYLRVGCSLEGRMVEYVDHLHEHFEDPITVVGGRYQLPTVPGYSATLLPEAIAEYSYPDGPVWAAD